VTKTKIKIQKTAFYELSNYFAFYCIT